jgi:aspartate/methionine/tyrosine aminotransferase
VNVTAHEARPDTVMGRALSERAVALIAAMAPQVDATTEGAAIPDDARAVIAPTEVFDLTRPETPAIPAPVQEAANAALDRGETHYTTRPGVTALREAIARRMTEEGFPATADAMLITNGGSEALYIALQTLLEKGQRIIVAGPTQPNIIEMIRFIGAEPVWVPTAGSFFPSAGAIDAMDASAILLASPSPVTGFALSSADLETMIETAIRRDMTVFLDRSLATALYDPAVARFGNPDLGAKVVAIGSFSTGHGLTGWRVGWLTAPAELMKRPRELKQDMSICTTAVSQFAALAFLDVPEESMASRREEFARRRDEAIAGLQASGLTPVTPEAFPALLIDVRTVDDDDRRFAARLRQETGVIVQPGSLFSPATTGFVRLDLGVPAATLRDGIAQLAAFATRERPR